MLNEKSKNLIKEMAMAYAEDICVGSNPDYAGQDSTTPLPTSGYLEVFNTKYYPHALVDLFPNRMNLGKWKKSMRINKGDLVHHTTDDPEWGWGRYYVALCNMSNDNEAPGKSDKWAEVEHVSNCCATRLDREGVSPGCKGCTRQIPGVPCMLTEWNKDDFPRLSEFLTSEECGKYTTDEIFTCLVCPHLGIKCEEENGRKIEYDHCYRTGLYFGWKPSEKHPLPNKGQCSYYGMTVKEVEASEKEKRWADKCKKCKEENYENF